MLAAASLGPSTVIRSIRKRAGSGAGSWLQAGIPPARKTRRIAIARTDIVESFNARLLQYWPRTQIVVAPGPRPGQRRCRAPSPLRGQEPSSGKESVCAALPKTADRGQEAW